MVPVPKQAPTPNLWTVNLTRRTLTSMFDPQVEAVIERVDRLREQVDDHYQIPRVEAEVLAMLVHAARSRSVLEIGTSYGFSTLHLAAATRPFGGHVHSIDILAKKRDAASAHLAQAGLSEYVTLHLGDAREVIASIEPRQPFDCVFIDAVKQQCFDYLAAVWPRLANHAMLITDNTHTHAAELAPFVAHLRGHRHLRSCGINVGNGFELSVKLAVAESP